MDAVTTRSAWGKTDSDGQPSHHLVHHSMDVAAVFEALARQPVIAERLRCAAGRTLEDFEHQWLAAFSFLHDIGKISPRFQAKAWPAEKRRNLRSHLAEGWCWLADLSSRGGAMDGTAHALFAPISASRDGLPWVYALFAHHGRPTQRKNHARWPILSEYDWRIEEARMGEALRAWFPDAAWGEPSALVRPRLVHLFAGLLALADWIGSDVRSFPHELEPDVLGYGARARARAAEAVRRIGITDTPWPDKLPSFCDLTGFDDPRGVQACVTGLSLETPLAIIEAETGSGKTEAALWHFARLRSAGVVDGLYFAVPTRAAAWQLFERVQKIMRRIDGPETILAVPGQLKAGEAEGKRLPGFEVRWDDGANHWAAEHATRFLAAPIAVGTIDQVLMAGLQVKHAHLRGAGLSRSLLVIDEVHASDAYMNRIARGVVRDHLALGGRALLMSATLGAVERAEWLGQALPDLDAAKRTGYPAVWRSDDNAPLEPVDAGRNAMKQVCPKLVPTMNAEQATDIAIDAARRGARVLVIRNTVDQAVATWQAVIEREPSLCLQVEGHTTLHHSRFAAEDRRRLDAAIESAFGKGAPDTAVIAVGTQTLEQSLDIDADVLITDLCPMDVLLQRVGRLHRHARTRPAGCEAPTVHILCPDGGLDRLAQEKRFENGLGAWEARGVLNGIYVDLRVVEATRRLASENRVWKIPQDNRALVEAATHPDALDAIDAEMGWQDYTNSVIAKMLADIQHAGLNILDRGERFPEQFPDADEKIQTRLGSPGPIWELPSGTPGVFGLPITRIAPPAQWCAGLTGEEVVEVATTSRGMRITVGDRRFEYTTTGLSRHPKDAE